MTFDNDRLVTIKKIGEEYRFFTKSDHMTDRSGLGTDIIPQKRDELEAVLNELKSLNDESAILM
jgi:hypothetical protein